VTRKGFWIAQLLWWGFYVGVFYLAALPTFGGSARYGMLLYFVLKVAKASVGFAASLVLYALYVRWTPRLRLPVLGACAIAASFVLAVGWELAARAIYRLPIINDQLIRDAMLPTFVLTAWSALYFSFVYRDRANRESERALRATALATEAELAMLRYQVNPHFLFNSLNSLRALIDENPAAARTMVTQLADLFRHSLRTTSDDLTVGDEITAIRNYLDIQKIRFDDSLDATVDVDGAASETQLAAFLIHPLVENAVKYGRETSDKPLRVQVRVRRDGDRLDVVVRNTGRWLENGAQNGAGTGTGLRNLRARLVHLSPERHTLEVGAVDGGVRAHLTLEVGA
jgi:hypothetical protein